jgi:hypothetical protein
MFSNDKKADCPLWKAPCKEHSCRWYIQVQGANPNTGEQFNKWDCAISWLPLLLIEGAQQSRQTGAAVESFRNEMVVANAQTRNALVGSLANQLPLQQQQQLGGITGPFPSS